MLNNRFSARIGIIIGIISWAALIVVDLVILFGQQTNLSAGIQVEISHALFDVLIIGIWLFYRYNIEKAENFKFLDMLWKVFVTGLIATILSLLMQGFLVILRDTKLSQNPLVISFFYHVNITLVLLYLLSTFIVWKRLILYQKSRMLVSFWYVFEYSLVALVFYNFIREDAGQTLFFVVLGIMLIMSLILSANLKWVAYLNFKQKWRGLLLILLSVLYVIYFFFTIMRFPQEFMVSNALNNAFVIIIFGFVLIYAIFSFLVILFNLPTSSVFEQKLEEILNFQRLSQSIQSGQNEDQVYDILMDSAISTTLASAGWIEYKFENQEKRTFTQGITREQVEQVKASPINKKYKISEVFSPLQDHEAVTQTRINVEVNEQQYRSMITFPLIIQRKPAGYLTLLKDIADGFNKEMIDIVSTFVNQACVSLENIQLLQEAIENERYKEELKIAETVQKNLLPERLVSNGTFRITAFSQAASEVGGDYYDLFQISPYKMGLIIGDVSGKGTSAAFHMSQMKGIFHSLVQLDLSVKEFMIHANNAVGRCLDKNSFITITYFLIDTKTREITFSRAGHCPTLYFSSQDGTTNYYENKGLGLGMLRNDSFADYIEISEMNYRPGDILLLYTDGIIEAKNKAGEEYGYTRLAAFMRQNGYLEVDEVKNNLIQDVYNFCGEVAIDDDYTALVIKFN